MLVCNICEEDCVLWPEHPRTPGVVVLKDGKSCDHVFDSVCFKQWTRTASTRSFNYLPGVGYQRRPLSCPVCKQEIIGFWPILSGWKFDILVEWGHDEDQPKFVPRDQVKTVQTSWTLGYYYDGHGIDHHHEESTAAVTSRKEMYRCHKCGHEVESRSGLYRHLNEFHREYDPEEFKCSVCQKKYASARSLKRHLNGSSSCRTN